MKLPVQAAGLVPRTDDHGRGARLFALPKEPASDGTSVRVATEPGQR